MNVIESSSLACCSSNAGDEKADNKSQSANRVQKHRDLTGAVLTLLQRTGGVIACY